MSVTQGGAFVDDGDLFHSVTMNEKISWKQGYAEGVKEGRARDYAKGFVLGAQKGAEIGKEIGFYAGFAAYTIHQKQAEDKKSKVYKVCKAIIKLARIFDDVQPTDESLTDNLSKIQAKFKQLSSLLGVKVEFITVYGDNLKGSSF